MTLRIDMALKRAHKHHKEMKMFAEDAAKDTRPWILWEYKAPDAAWNPCMSVPIWFPDHDYRRKPEMLTCNGIEFPAPERNAPETSSVYYAPSLTSTSFFALFMWGDDYLDRQYLRRRLIHLTEEAAIQHTKALLAVSEIKET